MYVTFNERGMNALAMLPLNANYALHNQILQSIFTSSMPEKQVLI